MCVLALPGWSLVPLPREGRRKPVFVYVDAALDGGGGVYKLGPFSMELGLRSAVPLEQPPNHECAEARAILWGLKFILNVGVREAHLFGDNAGTLVQFLWWKASLGFVYQRCLRKWFRYRRASCPSFTVYIRWVRCAVNPADPIIRLHGQLARDVGLAREAATRKVGDLWAFPERKTVFMWTVGFPTGPFVLPQAWPSGIRPYEGGGFHDVFLQHRLEESVGAMAWHARSKSGSHVRLSQPCERCVLFLHLLRPSVSLPAL